MQNTAVLIMAAGRGSRMGEGKPKQYRDLADKPILAHSLLAFARHPAVNTILTVIHPDDEALSHAAYDSIGMETRNIRHGGASRQASTLNGLRALREFAPDLVLVHDGARPLVSAALIDRAIAVLSNARAAIPAVPVTDTIKQRDGDLIAKTVDRSQLAAAQTPQAFAYSHLLAAHEKAADSPEQFTDDASIIEWAGGKVRLFEGDPDNIKITVKRDLKIAMASLGIQTHYSYRTGMGYDVHAFAPGDQLTLCGVKIPFEKSLKGHSDADVGLHALTDAVLGALAAGDIGKHFPPSDPQWKGVDSETFLADARDRAAALGARIEHVDVTLICERPKISPHREAMTARIAAILDIAPGAVSVKATTTEGLGFTGRREGIAAQAVATVKIPVQNTESSPT